MITFRLAAHSLAVKILRAANTLAADRVEIERGPDVVAEEMPFLSVTTGSETKLLVTEGTDALYEATLTLHIDVRVGSADLIETKRQLDTMIGQVQDALLQSPDFWMPQPNGSKLLRKVPKIEILSGIKQDAEINYGVGQVSIDLFYGDAYTIDYTQDLASIAVTVAPFTAAPAAPPASPPVPVSVTLRSP